MLSRTKSINNNQCEEDALSLRNNENFLNVLYSKIVYGEQRRYLQPEKTNENEKFKLVSKLNSKRLLLNFVLFFGYSVLVQSIKVLLLESSA